jgi:hypothetical protein
MNTRLKPILIEASRLSKVDAKNILADIETGKGRIVKIMEKKPELKAQMTDGLPNKIEGWRAVAAMGSLRSEKVVSLSTNFDVVFGMGSNFPSIMSSKGIQSPKVTLLHYKIPKSKVLAYVPVLIKYARAVLADKIKTVAGRDGGRINVSAIYDAANSESEIIADVSGLKPKVIAFDQTSNGRIDLAMVQDIRKKKYKNPKQYFDYLKKSMSGWYPFDPMNLSDEEREQKMNEFLTGLDKKAKEIKEFFK